MAKRPKTGRPRGRKDSKTSPRAIAIAKKRGEALEYRLAGWSFRAIGEAMGCSAQRAYVLVEEALKATLNDPAETVRTLELVRLDEMMIGAFDAAKNGDGAAVDRVLKIMDRRAKLLGLDAPEKHEVAGAGGGPIQYEAVEYRIVHEGKPTEDAPG